MKLSPLASSLCAALVAAPLCAQQSAHQLHLRFGSFDPVAEAPPLPRQLRADDSACRLHVVLFERTPTESDRALLAQYGERICYLPDDAYIVRIDQAD